jgi:hypothetical protein
VRHGHAHVHVHVHVGSTPTSVYYFKVQDTHPDTHRIIPPYYKP